MLIFVVTFNLLLALTCLYAAWRVWRFSRKLARAADVLTLAEQRTHRVLSGAPAAISRGQLSAAELRRRYHQLAPQLQQAQQALSLIGLGVSLWRGEGIWGRRRSPRRPGKFR